MGSFKVRKISWWQRRNHFSSTGEFKVSQKHRINSRRKYRKANQSKI